MKRFSLALVLLVAAAAAACQKQAAPDRAASNPSPSAVATPAVPPQAAPAAAPVRAGSHSRSAQLEPTPETTHVAPAAPVAGPVTEPTPTPAPPRVVQAGTVLPIVLKRTLTTETAKPEDRVVAELAEPVVAHGDELLPAGSEVLGHVVTAVRSGRVSGRARLVVAFDQIHAEGRTFDIEATRFDITAKSSKGRDAKIAGGAAAAGAIIGAIAGGGSGALKGGVIGGAAGGGAVLATRGYEVELPAGSRYTITLKSSIRLD